MYDVPSVKESPTKQIQVIRDPYNGLLWYYYQPHHIYMAIFHIGILGSLPQAPATTIIQSRTFRGPAPEMKVFKADLWEGIFLDLEIGKLSSECLPRWKG